ncbi:tetratricopeptide repeat protein [Streptomyces sp. NPDC003362]
MDAAELDRRALTHDGWIPPHLVSWLVDHGHADEVERQARAGDWFCAQAWVRILVEEDRRDEALEVLGPYLATGWWEAAHRVAELLEAWGRVDEAIAAFRANMRPDGRRALKYFALLLARNGRGDEAFGLLLPHLDDWFLADALVEASAGLGRDEELASLLAARVDAGREGEWPDFGGRTTRPGNAIDLLATVRERQGRVDEAIALLRTRQITSVNGRDQLADLLARHERIEELREYAATDPLGDAAQCLAEYLEQRGDVAGAIDVYRTLAPEDMPHTAVLLSLLLARHGRGDEAIELLSSLPSAAGGDEDWVVGTLCTLYIEQGRAEDGLAHLDGLKARVGGESDDEASEFFRLRTKLLVACGRREQAIEEARARPGSDGWYETQNLARLLSDAGRPEEAVAVLDPAVPANRKALAAHLMAAGRIEDSLALFREPVEEAEPLRSRIWPAVAP